MQRRIFLLAPAAMAARPARAQAPTTLRFLWWGGSDRHARTLKAIAAFEARHPGVRVKAEYMGFNGYLEKLTMQMASGTEADVLQINWAWLAMFSRQGTGFLDLQQQAGAIALDQFSAADLDSCRVNGRLNGLPVSYTARLFLWNQSTFQRAGLALPRSWDELFAAGPAFKARLGEGFYPLDGEPYDMLLLAHAHVMQQHGTPYVHPTEPRVAMSAAALLDWVQTYRRLGDTGTCTPVPYRASLGGVDKPTEQQQDWVAGRWAGNFTWDSAFRLRASTLAKGQQLALGEYLTLPGAQTSGLFARPTLLFSVSRHTRQPELAARFLDFMTTDVDAARILGTTRALPSAARARDALEREGQVPPLELAAQRQIRQLREAGRVQVPSPRFEDARLRRLMREVFERISYRKLTDQEAARRLLDEGNALLSRMT
ncbi:ABC transporter substrate-binding protein [Ideonella sp. BN130291]|uniref:ABC transporter substrate-binding protein n=1 Tax=Ideonella sp. BN130291 TaxID=3112940 RepID=UPI002E263626|nr:ABC transporter substrate-binding protein [Ideonella sp. BN130291]